MNKKKILIVCQWPLGGIRTYLKYYYKYFPKDTYEISLLAKPSHESESVLKDMNDIGVKVIWAEPFMGIDVFFLKIFSVLRKGQFDIIHSQGFISASHASIANIFFKTYHILTIHGILEDKYFNGITGKIKHFILKNLLKQVNTFHGVGEDILTHFHSTYPIFKNKRYDSIVIKNGILTEKFTSQQQVSPQEIKTKFSLSEDKIIFGFFGRFMPQKGFNYLIDAVEQIKNKNNNSPFVILCVGSGDYKAEYMAEITEKKLDDYFMFLPFQSDIASLIKVCNAVLMPSVWEAYPMQSSEILCSGIPLIASDCIGLREATVDTPAITIPAHDSSALKDAIMKVVNNPDIAKEFSLFQAEAAKRFDVKPLAEKLVAYFDKLG